MKTITKPQKRLQNDKVEQKRAPWPWPIHNGLPLLPAKKPDPNKWQDALV
jgi:hypothetical protein